MHLSFSEEEKAFQREVRDWITANMPPEVAEESRRSRSSHVSKERLLQWQKKLAGRGWLCPNWPKEYGGPNWNSTQKFIFEMEMARADSPYLSSFSIKMVAPVLMKYGSEAQKKRFLPKIAAAEELWCQGYSEPGSGSDLASLRTKAEKQGDHYIVNGSKTWNTMGHWADWIFCLVRTDPKAKPQEGISFLLIDMKTPGITVKPIIMADGGHEVNEVFFDNVKVPIANLVGKENEGWTCAKFLLANERLGIAAVPQSKRGVEALKDIARAEQENGKPLIENQSFAEKIADLEIQVTALEYTELRVLSQMAQGGQPGPEVSGLKVRGSEIQQRITELTMEAVGEYAAPYQPGMLFQDTNETPVGPDHAPPAAPRYFNMRKTSIYGGSTEIQKNIVSKMVLGL
jgi:hypothetical protein